MKEKLIVRCPTYGTRSLSGRICYKLNRIRRKGYIYIPYLVDITGLDQHEEEY